MTFEQIQKRLHSILDHLPALKSILLSDDPLELKRKQVRYFISDILFGTFDDNPNIPPLKWELIKNAINVFRNLISVRGEKLSGFSFIGYLNDLVHAKDLNELKEPSVDFFEELEHLVKCMANKADVYSGKQPEFLKYHGKQAALIRSADLSTIAANMQKFMDRYISGMDQRIIKLRKRHQQRIIEYFGATASDWYDWHWHIRHIIRDADTLKDLVRITDEEYNAIKFARQHRIPFGITPYYVSLMDYQSDRKRDYGIRSQVIPSLYYCHRMKAMKETKVDQLDFMMERDTSPIDGITRRYPKILIIKPILTCPQICVYCQRNWEIEDVCSSHAILTEKKLDKAIHWIEKTPAINEVLITGGDPLLLSNERIKNLLSKISRIDHIDRIRIGTRIPVTLPQRITDSLVQTIASYHQPGKRELIIITHFEHLYEITPEAMAAVQKFRLCGIDVYNQLVYTFYNSRKFEACALRHNLRLMGVTPYYTFNTKGKEETNDFRVPIARLMQEQKEEARLMPGTVRTDEIVFNVPRLGKNYLRAAQHHDVITILPDGRRVYEFHPWEKKLSLMNTYIYKDVSIYEYLQRLKKWGEDIRDYKTIWYYY